MVAVDGDGSLQVKEVEIYKRSDKECYLRSGVTGGDKILNKNVLLVYNALKNTIRGYVEVFYEIDKHCVRIGVKDTGRGIPQNMLEKIFERFEKVDSFAQGVGLGLSICKSIVDKMNGRIQVYSQLGLGTTFIAELPCHSILVNE